VSCYDDHYDDSHNLDIDEHNLDVDDACALHNSKRNNVPMFERHIVFLHCERLLSGC
jgi:hypothetical protein